MLFELELLRRLPKYKREGLIDEVSVGQLTEHLEGKVASSKVIFKVGLYLVGILFIIVSISLLASNVWNNLSINTRLGSSFIPLILSACIGLFVLLKEGNRFFQELSAVLLISSFMLMLVLLTETTLLYGSELDFYFACTLVTLPIMLIFKSDVASIAMLVFLSTLAWFDFESHFILYILYIGVLTDFMCVYILRDYKNASLFRIISCYVLFVTIWIITYALLEHLVKKVGLWHVGDDGIVYHIIMIGMGILLLFSEGFKYFSKMNIFAKPFFISACVILSISCFSMSYSRGFNDIFRNAQDAFSKLFAFNFSSIVILFAMLFICVSWCVLFYKVVKDLKNNYPIIIGSFMLPCILLATLFNGGGYVYFMILSSAIYFSTALAFSIKGISTKSFLNMNLGIVMIIAFIINRSIVADVHIVIRAIFFAVCGVLLIVSNFYLNRERAISNEK